MRVFVTGAHGTSLAQRSCVSYLQRGTRCSDWRAATPPPVVRPSVSEKAVLRMM
jgi:hypothetical protein